MVYQTRELLRRRARERDEEKKMGSAVNMGRVVSVEQILLRNIFILLKEINL